MTKRFELTTDANTDAILLIIDHQDNVMWSFLKDHEEAVQGVFKRLTQQDERIQQLEAQLKQCQATKNNNGRFQVWSVPPIKEGIKLTTTTSEVKLDD